MVSLEKEYLQQIRAHFKDRRIALGLKQVEAADRSGVNISTLRIFEKTGQISLGNLLSLSVIYKMDRRMIEAVTDRTWWTIEELERAERLKTVR